VELIEDEIVEAGRAESVIVPTPRARILQDAVASLPNCSNSFSVGEKLCNRKEIREHVEEKFVIRVR
jgi:hypothetical protein